MKLNYYLRFIGRQVRYTGFKIIAFIIYISHIYWWFHSKFVPFTNPYLYIYSHLLVNSFWEGESKKNKQNYTFNKDQDNKQKTS